MPGMDPAASAVPDAALPRLATAAPRRQVVAWALWDWGSAAFNAVMVTFVFGTYLASDAFGPDERGTAWLSTALAVAGVVIALTAPVMGRRADGAGRRRLWLGVMTAAVIACTTACFLVTPQESSLLLGVTMIALGTVFFEFAEVQVNAILVQISTPATIGRISGIGWGAGYLGGILLLLIVFVGFVSGDAHWFGITGDEALNIRVVALVAAAWFLVFAIPVLVAVPDPAPAPTPGGGPRRESLAASYRALGSTLARMWRQDRNTLWFLVSSAVFRDGVGAVFVYGAILGTTVYGLAASDVILFAIVANVVAAAGAFAGAPGRRDRPATRDPGLAGRHGPRGGGPGPGLGHPGVLDRRAGAVPVRRPGAVRLARLPGPPHHGADGGGGVRPLRDDGPRGRVHHPDARDARARGGPGQPRGHPRHRARADRRRRAVRAGDGPGHAQR